MCPPLTGSGPDCPGIRPLTPERIARLRRVLDLRQPDLTVVTDFVHKQRNLANVQHYSIQENTRQTLQVIRQVLDAH